LKLVARKYKTQAETASNELETQKAKQDEEKKASQQVGI